MNLTRVDITLDLLIFLVLWIQNGIAILNGKKVLIACGAGLAAATACAGYLTAKVAGALLARISFHVI